ncbi:uncharacterized protein EV154DRAFT_476364 [Mucor mucedo]|uniref:uncharacterized protein n=1 Tax=Mucor mucedo TaxID=29922 RepID=UPI0022200F9A|nr:uncharacterized protein EV154DRAFT_476364 [Mucor mucedo]KAI7896727.1 hypothetical protein EV154DRAFT_476364 [Mucor mucedo]
MASGIYAPNQIKSHIIYYVIKKNYPNDHPTMIMYCLEKFNITLHIQGQSAVLPVEGRPMATPKKRVNPYIDDEAGCSDDRTNDNNDSGARQVNDALKAKKAPVVKKGKNALPDLQLVKNNIQLMATENMLMQIVIPVAPQLTDKTKQSELEVFASAVRDYYDNNITLGNWGTTIQYAGCYHFYCFGEKLKKEYPGFHDKFVDLLKECNYTTHKIALIKTVGNRFNILLRYFEHGALAIAALCTTDSMRVLIQAEFADIITFIQKDRPLTIQLRSMKLHPDMIERTSDLKCVDFKPKKAL